jgi:hypothetical protein
MLLQDKIMIRRLKEEIMTELPRKVNEKKTRTTHSCFYSYYFVLGAVSV